MQMVKKLPEKKRCKSYTYVYTPRSSTLKMLNRFKKNRKKWFKVEPNSVQTLKRHGLEVKMVNGVWYARWP